jgi:predicted nuclease of predicted toxin-antitoxin system
MRILIDECVPRKIKWSFPDHRCATAQEAGWGGRQNGDLLALAEEKFDVFLTVDKGLRYQHNLSGRNIAVLIIRAKSNDIDDILPHVPDCNLALQSIRPGDVVVIGADQDARS